MQRPQCFNFGCWKKDETIRLAFSAKRKTRQTSKKLTANLQPATHALITCVTIVVVQPAQPEKKVGTWHRLTISPEPPYSSPSQSGPEVMGVLPILSFLRYSSERLGIIHYRASHAKSKSAS